MSDVDVFIAEIHPRLVAELQALHNGDPGPRLAMWSTEDPVTLFGAGMSGSGWHKVSGIFRSIASRWSDCTDQRTTWYRPNAYAVDASPGRGWSWSIEIWSPWRWTTFHWPSSRR